MEPNWTTKEWSDPCERCYYVLVAFKEFSSLQRIWLDELEDARNGMDAIMIVEKARYAATMDVQAQINAKERDELKELLDMRLQTPGRIVFNSEGGFRVENN